MQNKDFTISITVDATAAKAFEDIKNVSRWWTENLEGSSQNLGDEFSVRFGDVHYSRQKLIELVPAKKLVWLVTDSRLNFLKDKQEWNHTRISFELTSAHQQTTIRFSHIGLLPDIECYGACSNAWSEYIRQSLFNLISNGKGQPALKENTVAKM